MKNTYKLYIAMTLDGYIATKDDNLDWLMSVEGEGDNGYQNFYDQIDTIIMGKRTYDWIVDNIDDYPYTDKDNYILTSNKVIHNNVESFDNVDKLIEELKNKDRNIWIVGGGQIISEFLNRKLISDMKITIAPVILGDGIPLFSNINDEVKLKLVNTTTYNQFVELEYNIY